MRARSATFFSLFFCLLTLGPGSEASAGMHAYGGDDAIDEIAVHAVYYLAKDDSPLPDWRERISYLLDRIERFHQRELGGQSVMKASLLSEPFIASATRGGFPQEDANSFFFHMMDEIQASGRVQLATDAFPILLVMADMNFCPGYDDWTRACDETQCICPDHSACAGYVNDQGEDYPGTCCGGARAVYWPARHRGLGLVTADGWRVPLRGSDCVVYHEGIGHSIGLPHPDPINNSVMGLAQYVGYLHESWMDEDQKQAMGWQPEPIDQDGLFSQFHVRHLPLAPKAGETVWLEARWPQRFDAEQVKAAVQGNLREPFASLGEPAINKDGDETRARWRLPAVALGEARAYRVSLQTRSGETEELWGYLRVRSE